jgi:hypothetical protein
VAAGLAGAAVAAATASAGVCWVVASAAELGAGLALAQPSARNRAQIDVTERVGRTVRTWEFFPPLRGSGERGNRHKRQRAETEKTEVAKCVRPTRTHLTAIGAAAPQLDLQKLTYPSPGHAGRRNSTGSLAPTPRTRRGAAPLTHSDASEV